MRHKITQRAETRPQRHRPLIGDNPRMGRIYEGRTHQFVHGKHIILYRIGTDHVVIGRIFHGAQARDR